MNNNEVIQRRLPPREYERIAGTRCPDCGAALRSHIPYILSVKPNKKHDKSADQETCSFQVVSLLSPGKPCSWKLQLRAYEKKSMSEVLESNASFNEALAYFLDRFKEKKSSILIPKRR